jgi:hypothetical protein
MRARVFERPTPSWISLSGPLPSSVTSTTRERFQTGQREFRLQLARGQFAQAVPPVIFDRVADANDRPTSEDASVKAIEHHRADDGRPSAVLDQREELYQDREMNEGEQHTHHKHHRRHPPPVGPPDEKSSGQPEDRRGQERPKVRLDQAKQGRPVSLAG